MSKNHNIIEINNRRYDARSGLPLDAKSPKPSKSLASVKQPTTIKTTAHTLAPKLIAHQPEKAKTLMRKSVKRPAPSVKRSLVAHGHLHSATKLSLAKPVPRTKLDAARLNRAQAVSPAKAINRFGVVAPKAIAELAEQAKSLITETEDSSSLIVERALNRATGHLQPKAKLESRSRRLKLSRKHQGLAASLAGLILLAGFVGVSNISRLRLHEADSKAGFAAVLPSSQPSGFRVGSFSYSAGEVAIHFSSNSDSRSFAIVEKPSSWNNQSLVDYYLAPATDSYQTIQAPNGQTIYLYGNNQATWVAHGIWYNVQDNGNLSDSQLMSLAGNS